MAASKIGLDFSVGTTRVGIYKGTSIASNFHEAPAGPFDFCAKSKAEQFGTHKGTL